MPNGTPGSFIRPALRDAIYARDRRTCVYCGATEDLTLDHLTPPDRRRTSAVTSPNHPTNLVTACRWCNSAKGSRILAEFVEDLDHRDRILRQRKHRVTRLRARVSAAAVASGVMDERRALTEDPLRLLSLLAVRLEEASPDTPLGEIRAWVECEAALDWLDENPPF